MYSSCTWKIYNTVVPWNGVYKIEAEAYPFQAVTLLELQQIKLFDLLFKMDPPRLQYLLMLDPMLHDYQGELKSRLRDFLSYLHIYIHFNPLLIFYLYIFILFH